MGFESLTRSKIFIIMNTCRKNIYFILGIIFIALFGICFFLISRNYVGADEGSYLYEPSLVLMGKIPFKDFISRAPVEIYFLALLFKFFGNSVAVIKIINTLVVTAIGLMVYQIVRQHQKQSVAVVASLCTFINMAFILPLMVTSSTSFSILLVLLSCYFLKKEGWKNAVLSGSLLALAVFTRETNAIFVLFILIFFIITKKWQKLYQIIIGGLAISLIAIGFFAYHVGLFSAINMLLGIGHLGVQEEKILSVYSLSILKFFVLPLIPLIGYFLVLKKDFAKTKFVYPEILWVIATGIFYLFYFNRRGFLLSYGAEFVPLIIIIIFTICHFETSWYYKKSWQAIILPLLIIFSFLPLALIRPVPVRVLNSVIKGFNINVLINGNVPAKDFSKINNIIHKVTNPNDVVLTGNLAFVSENNLQQFMDISRPMAYNGQSTVYKLYKAPSPQTILQEISLHPPKVIIDDGHLYASLWRYIQNFVISNYSVYYRDGYVIVFVLKPLSPQMQTIQTKT